MRARARARGWSGVATTQRARGASRRLVIGDPAIETQRAVKNTICGCRGASRVAHAEAQRTPLLVAGAECWAEIDGSPRGAWRRATQRDRRRGSSSPRAGPPTSAHRGAAKANERPSAKRARNRSRASGTVRFERARAPHRAEKRGEKACSASARATPRLGWWADVAAARCGRSFPGGGKAGGLGQLFFPSLLSALVVAAAPAFGGSFSQFCAPCRSAPEVIRRASRAPEI